MSNEEENNSNSVMENQTKVDKSKRKFSKAGLVAPIIMTLASKPVFAVQGLSNMLSGNTSVCRGDIFYGGKSHGYWKKPKDSNGSRAACIIALSHISGKDFDKVTIADAFAGHTPPPDTNDTDTLLSVVQSNINPKCQIVAGYLNLFFYLNSGDVGKSYFLTEEQFWALNDGNISKWSVPAGYTGFVDLIEQNMDGNPGDICNADGSFVI
jgi:hypothetical protein